MDASRFVSVQSFVSIEETQKKIVDYILQQMRGVSVESPLQRVISIDLSVFWASVPGGHGTNLGARRQVYSLVNSWVARNFDPLLSTTKLDLYDLIPGVTHSGLTLKVTRTIRYGRQVVLGAMVASFERQVFSAIAQAMVAGTLYDVPFEGTFEPFTEWLTGPENLKTELVEACRSAGYAIKAV